MEVGRKVCVPPEGRHLGSITAGDAMVAAKKAVRKITMEERMLMLDDIMEREVWEDRVGRFKLFEMV